LKIVWEKTSSLPKKKGEVMGKTRTDATPMSERCLLGKRGGTGGQNQRHIKKHKKDGPGWGSNKFRELLIAEKKTTWGRKKEAPPTVGRGLCGCLGKGARKKNFHHGFAKNMENGTTTKNTGLS